jgi:hypothetical protein
MNSYSEILKLKTKLLAAGISCTLDESEDLEGKLPIVAIEAGNTEGEYTSAGKFDVNQHNIIMHCVVSAHEINFDTACANAELLATNVMKNFTGLKIRVKKNGVDRGGLLIGSEKAREVILDCIASD